jgi:ribonuclease BN (tRNA processing enzyme)
VERVVLSHFHIDHCLDLFALAFARNNKSIQPVPQIEIVGPVGLAELLARGESTLGRRAKDPNAVITEVALDSHGRGQLEREGARLSCVANGHRPEAVSWRADLADATSFAYTGDTPEDARVAELAHGVDLFVIECSHPDDRAVAGHLTPSSAGRLARDSQCRRVLLTHFYPDMDPELARAGVAKLFTGPIDLAHDGSIHLIRSGR